MASASGLAAAALVVNALVWGLSWWPFRQLDAQGLHPLWATVVVYAVASLALFAARPRSLRDLARPSSLWVLVTAAGTTNAAFNWAVSIGDVVRVVLLFYLMPLWAVLLARVLLHEAITARSMLRVALGMAGAGVVLWPQEGVASWSSAWLPDVLSVIGGFSFALNNIMVRREQQHSEAARAAAMFVGGAVVAGALGLVLAGYGSVPLPRLEAAAAPGAWGAGAAWAGWLTWGAWVMGLSAAFLVANLCLQYGASRLPAQRSAVIMLTEVLFASASAVALGAGAMTPALWLGGACIMASAWLAAFD